MKNIRTVIEIFIMVLTAYISFSVYTIKTALDWKTHDLYVLQEFQKNYFDPSNDQSYNPAKKKLAIKYIDLIKNKETRISLREYIIWDILYSTIRKPENEGRKYKFNSDNPIWGSYAFNMIRMKEDDKPRYDSYISNVKTDAFHEFKDYADIKEVDKIFEEINKQWPGTK